MPITYDSGNTAYVFPGREIQINFVAQLASSYSLSPLPPSDYTFSNGLLIGVCNKLFTQDFVITASNDGGRIARSFTFTCTKVCPASNEPMLVRAIENNKATALYTLNIVNDQGNRVMNIPDRSHVTSEVAYMKCVNVGNGGPLTISGSNTNIVSIRFEVSTLGYNPLTVIADPGTALTPKYYSAQYSVNLQPGTVTFTKTDFKGYYPLAISITPTVTGNITQYSFYPYSPYWLKIDYNTFRIYGTIDSPLGRETYTLRTGVTGKLTDTTFTFDVGDCNDLDQLPFIGEFVTDPDQIEAISWSFLIDGVETIRFDPSEFQRGTTISRSECIIAGKFTLELRHPLGYSWEPSSSLTISILGNVIGTYAKTSGSIISQIPTQQIDISLIFAIDPVSGWNYTNSELPQNWKDPSFISNQWIEKPLSSLTDFEGTTIYIKKFIRDIDANDVNTIGIELIMTHKEGVIVYINGQEIYRKFLPSGTITYDTLATGYSYQPIEITLFFGRNLLNSTGNVIAIEYHKYFMDFFMTTVTAYFKISKSDCISLLPEGFLLESSGNSLLQNPVKYAVDNDRDTTWVERYNSISTVDPYLTFYLGEHKYFWFDTYGIRSSVNSMLTPTKNPSKVDVVASNDYDNKQLPTLLFQIQSESERKIGRFYDNYKLYNIFQFRFTDRLLTKEDTQIADIVLEACHKLYCSEDSNFPATSQGQTSRINCPLGYTGLQSRFCEINRYPKWEDINLSGCSPDKPTDFRYPGPEFSFYEDETLLTPLRPHYISVLNVTFSTTPSLPLGLHIDVNNGTIYGTPIEKTPPTLYTISAINSVGETTTILQITIKRYECFAEAVWPETKSGTTASIDCIGGSNGKRTRFCSGGTYPVWSDPDSRDCSESRSWTEPNDGEVYLSGSVVYEMGGNIDIMFLDHIRNGIHVSVANINLPSILLRLQNDIPPTVIPTTTPSTIETSSSPPEEQLVILKNIRESQGKMDLTIITTPETSDEVKLSVERAFSSGLIIYRLPTKYNVTKLEYKLDNYYYYSGKGKASVLTIVLSSVFGFILIVIVSICTYIRCKRRTSSKSGIGASKLSSSHGVVKSKATAGSSARSSRSTDKEKKSVHSVRL